MTIPHSFFRTAGFSSAWRVVLCLSALLVSPVLLAEEYGLWGEYAAVARIADLDRDEVTAERAWSAAASIAEKFQKDDPRKALTFAHWGLALTRTGNSGLATPKLKEAETLLATVDPPPTASQPARRRNPEVVEARGTWAWGTARNPASKRSERASQLALAVTSLTNAPLSPLRRAELFSESAVLQRSSGEILLAERHAQAAVDTLAREKFEDATLTEALVASALTHVDAGHFDLAQTAIDRAAELYGKLADAPLGKRPNEAALRTVALRVALERRDRAAAEETLHQIGTGSDRELSVGDHPLVSQFDLLAAVAELELTRGAADIGTVLNRLKILAGSDGHLRGRLLVLQGLDAKRADRLRDAVQNLTEGIGALEGAIGKSDPRLAAPLGEAAMLQVIVGQDAVATTSARRSVEVAQATLPATHPGQAEAMAALTRVELVQQHGGEAARLAATTADLAQLGRPAGDPLHDMVKSLAADAEAQAGNLKAARLHLKNLENASFDSHPMFERLLLHWHIGHAAHLSGDLGLARSHYAQSLQCGAQCRPDSTEPHSLTAWTRLCLNAIDQADSAEAGPDFAATWKILLRLKGTDEKAALEVTRQANACYSASRFRESVWLYDRSIEAYSRMTGDHGAILTQLKGYRHRARERLEAASKP